MIDKLKPVGAVIGAVLAVTVLTAIGADVVIQGLDVIGPNATTKNARAIVFTGSGVSTNTTAGGTNTVTISGGGATFSPTWVEVARPADWMTSHFGATSTNVIGALWSYSRNNYQMLAWNSPSNTINDAYFSTDWCPPFGATGWGSGNAFSFPIRATSNSSAVNKIDLLITTPSGSQTNVLGIVPSAANSTQYILISTNYIPWSACTSNTSWRIEGTVYSSATNTIGIGIFKAHVQ